MTRHPLPSHRPGRDAVSCPWRGGRLAPANDGTRPRPRQRRTDTMGKWPWKYDDDDLFWRHIVVATKHPDYADLSTLQALRDLRTDDDTDR